jgi:hypothetical protein
MATDEVKGQAVMNDRLHADEGTYKIPESKIEASLRLDTIQSSKNGRDKKENLGDNVLIMPQYEVKNKKLAKELKKKKKEKYKEKDKKKKETKLSKENTEMKMEMMKNDNDEEKQLLTTRTPKNPSKLSEEQRNVALDKEINIPDLSKYRVIGFDSMKTRNKHYRRQLETPLKESKFLSHSEFENIEIYRGQADSQRTGFIGSLFFKKEDYKKVGIFRAGVSLIDFDTLRKLKSLGIEEELTELDIPFDRHSWETRAIDKDLLKHIELKVRIYVLDAKLYYSADVGSQSDPYLKVFVGNEEVFNGSDETIDDRNEPIFNRLIE